jgi:hypothetical protein
MRLDNQSVEFKELEYVLSLDIDAFENKTDR